MNPRKLYSKGIVNFEKSMGIKRLIASSLRNDFKKKNVII